MRKIFLLLLLLGCICLVQAQSRNGLYKFSLPGKSSIVLTGIGASYLFGDVGGLNNKAGLFEKSDFILSQTKYMFSINYRYVFKNNIGIKASALFGKFGQVDSMENGRNIDRKFEFSTNLTILAMHIEYNIIGGENAQYPTPHKVYVFGGAGAMISDVYFRSKKDKRPSDKHPVEDSGFNVVPGAPGYSFNTKVVTPTFPIGGGYEYEVTPNFSIGAEYVIHAAFTDFLDGVSTINSRNRDYLMNLDLTFTYKFGNLHANRTRVNWN